MINAEEACRLQQELQEKNRITILTALRNKIDGIITNACDNGNNYVVATWRAFGLADISPANMELVEAVTKSFFIPELKEAGYETRLSFSHKTKHADGVIIAWGSNKIECVQAIVDIQLE